MKHILITGGAGFIGSNLALKLVAKGHTVRVLDNLSEQIHGKDPQRDSPLLASLSGKVELIQGDVTSGEDWRKALEGQDVVVHLAAETGTGQSMYRIDHYNRVNIGGTALMLDILTNETHSVKRVIVASSRSIYGEGKYISPEFGAVYPGARSDVDMRQGLFEVTYPGSSALSLAATDETSKIHPSSVYGITKQVQEQLVMTVCPNLGIEPVAFRYQNVYGPGQSLSNPYTGILSIFSTQIKNGNDLNIFEDGKESRDFVYIDDVVEATIRGIEMPNAAGNVMNVGLGAPVDVMTVARSLIRLYGREVGVKVTGNYRLGDIRHNFADLTRIKDKLGFTPRVGFEEGIGRFAEWVNAQEVKADRYAESIAEMSGRGLFK